MDAVCYVRGNLSFTADLWWLYPTGPYNNSRGPSTKLCTSRSNQLLNPTVGVGTYDYRLKSTIDFPRTMYLPLCTLPFSRFRSTEAGVRTAEISGRSWLSQMWYSFLAFRFQCLLWIFTLGTGSTLAQLRNLDVFMSSTGQAERRACLVLFAVCTSVARIGSGTLSDLCVSRIPRINFLLVGLLCHGVTSVFAFVIAKDVTDVWLLLCLTGGLSYGLLWAICPTILAERYGNRGFSLFWPVLLTFSAVCSLVLQVGFVAIGNSFSFKDYLCDKLCIQLDVIVSTVLYLCSLFLTFGLAMKSKKKISVVLKKLNATQENVFF